MTPPWFVYIILLFLKSYSLITTTLVAVHPQTENDLLRKPTQKALVIPLLFTFVLLLLGIVSPARSNIHLAWTFGGVVAFLLAWQVILWFQSRRGWMTFNWEFVAIRSHYIQALLQLSIYAYWGWYWRNVYAETPLILAQLAFLYVFDALLTWSRGQTWRLGFGPCPIVLGSNLFMWFHDDWFVFQFLMVATGVLGKHFIRWQRDGRMTHIFNPSAFALTVFSFALLFTGKSNITWGEPIAITLGWAPHMYLLIFLCGVVVQYFFSVTLMTLSAAAAISLLTLAYTKMSGVYLFVDTNVPIAVFLGLHLLMTDPATTPRSDFGKAVFGGLYGAGAFVAFIILEAFGAPGFYDKLLLVPFLNLLTPFLDRLSAAGLAQRLGGLAATLGPRRTNLSYMTSWAALFLVMLTTGFVEAPHPGNTIEFWEKAAAANRPRAAENLVALMNNFIGQDIDKLSQPAGTLSEKERLDRLQSLGDLCNREGKIYAEGKYITADPAKAAYFFNRACEFGNPDGCANLAVHCLIFNHAEAGANLEKALAALEQNCSESANPNSRYCYLVGYAYDTGRGNPENKTKARMFYEKAAALGDLDACRNLAWMQLNGEGGSVDNAAAAHWLQIAVEAQDGPSCLLLARLYQLGDGVSKDEARATTLLEKACSLGVEPACQMLKEARK